MLMFKLLQLGTLSQTSPILEILKESPLLISFIAISSKAYVPYFFAPGLSPCLSRLVSPSYIFCTCLSSASPATTIDVIITDQDTNDRHTSHFIY